MFFEVCLLQVNFILSLVKRNLKVQVMDVVALSVKVKYLAYLNPLKKQQG